jgi:hypothetical protein
MIPENGSGDSGCVQDATGVCTVTCDDGYQFTDYEEAGSVELTCDPEYSRYDREAPVCVKRDLIPSSWDGLIVPLATAASVFVVLGLSSCLIWRCVKSRRRGQAHNKENQPLKSQALQQPTATSAAPVHGQYQQPQAPQAPQASQAFVNPENAQWAPEHQFSPQPPPSAPTPIAYLQHTLGDQNQQQPQQFQHPPQQQFGFNGQSPVPPQAFGQSPHPTYFTQQ